MKNFEIRKENEYFVEIFFQRLRPNHDFIKIARVLIDATEIMTRGKKYYNSYLIDNTGLILIFEVPNKKILTKVKRLAPQLNKIYEIVCKADSCSSIF